MKANHVFSPALALSILAGALFGSPCWSASHAPSVAPIHVNGSESRTLAMADVKPSAAETKRSFARVVAAAICTDDLATISFQEYEVDWSTWVGAVAARWSNAMNGAHAKLGLRPHGPMFVEFTCNRDGTISDVIVDRSSGDRMCDAVQVGTLLRCLPLPSFPSQSRKKNITLLCIWAYNHNVAVSKTAKRHTNAHKDVRLSITGATL